MSEDRRPGLAHEGAEGDVAPLGGVEGQRRRRRDGTDELEPCPGTLAHHLEADPSGQHDGVTGRALAKVKLVESGTVDFKAAGEDFLDMAKRYYSDAKHFQEKGDVVLAFAALNYAHGWLDAGARLGLFDVDGDNVLFTVD